MIGPLRRLVGLVNGIGKEVVSERDSLGPRHINPPADAHSSFRLIGYDGWIFPAQIVIAGESEQLAFLSELQWNVPLARAMNRQMNFLRVHFPVVGADQEVENQICRVDALLKQPAVL